MEGDGPKKQQTSDTGGLRGDTSLGRGRQSVPNSSGLPNHYADGNCDKDE